MSDNLILDLSAASDDHAALPPPITYGRLTLYKAPHLADLAPITWLVDDLLPSSGVACIYGASTAGKSFLCLDLAASVALGKDWFGHTTQKTNVLYIMLEGRAGLQQRVNAWEKHAGMSYPNDVTFLFAPWALTEPDDVQALVSAIRALGGC